MPLPGFKINFNALYLRISTMGKSGNISLAVKATKLVSVGLLFSCLLLLTGINFIIYSSAQNKAWATMADKEKSGDETSPSPVEEKSVNNTVNIQEEYVHEFNMHDNALALDNLNHHRIIEAGKLSIVHFELVSPPPES